MKSVVLVGLLSAAVFAGCLEEAAPPTDVDQPPLVQNAEPIIPAAIKKTETVTGAVDVAGNVAAVVGTGPDFCEIPTSKCFEYPFKVEADINGVVTPILAKITLTWGVLAHDFDLYLFQGTTQKDQSAGPAPPDDMPDGNEEITATLADAGDYKIRVVSWAVAMDTFNLDATFSVAPAA